MTIYYPPTSDFVQKTLDAQLLQGTTASATLNNTTSIQNKAGVMIIDRVDANGTETPSAVEVVLFTATSGSTVTTLTRGQAGTSDQDHAVGAIVEFGPDIIWAQGLIDTFLIEHSADGTHASTITKNSSSQTLTNKTLTSPVINTGVSGTAIDTDGTLAANSDTKLASQKAVKTYVDANTVGDWIQYSAVTPTRASADDPTYVLTFAAVDLTATLYVGMKVKLTQTTDKFFIITKISFSTNTTLTLFGGTDYDVADTGVTAISAFYYSSAHVPKAFPMSPAKWTHSATSSASDTQSSPVNGTWYNLGTKSIDIPIGAWNVEYQVNINGFKSGGAVIVDLWSTLSTANNSESDVDFSANVLHRAPSGTPVEAVAGNVTKSKLLDLASKTTYYLNAKSVSSSLGSITFPNNTSTMFVRAVCSYL